MDPVSIGLGLGGLAAGSGLLGGDAPNDYMREIGEWDAYQTMKLKNRLRKSPIELMGQTGLQEQALGMAGGYGDISPALGYFNDVLSGGYQNPYSQQIFDRAASGVRQKLDSQFANSGRYGSDAHQNVMADAYNDLATNIYGQERQYIDSAARALPGVMSQGISNAGLLYGLGEQDRALTERNTNQDFTINQMRLNALGAPMVNPTAMLQPQMTEGDPIMGGLGGAMGLLGFGKEMGWIGS